MESMHTESRAIQILQLQRERRSVTGMRAYAEWGASTSAVYIIFSGKKMNHQKQPNDKSDGQHKPECVSITNKSGVYTIKPTYTFGVTSAMRPFRESFLVISGGRSLVKNFRHSSLSRGFVATPLSPSHCVYALPALRVL